MAFKTYWPVSAISSRNFQCRRDSLKTCSRTTSTAHVKWPGGFVALWKPYDRWKRYQLKGWSDCGLMKHCVLFQDRYVSLFTLPHWRSVGSLCFIKHSWICMYNSVSTCTYMCTIHCNVFYCSSCILFVNRLLVNPVKILMVLNWKCLSL